MKISNNIEDTRLTPSLSLSRGSSNQSMQQQSFKGVLDGVVTTTLRTLDKNPMVNAVGIDLVAMVGPRTYVDTKERNKYAGFETFFREFTGTLTVCLSASYFAKWISSALNHIIEPEHKINSKSWFSNDSISFLKEVHKGTKTTHEYVSKIVNMLPNIKEPYEYVDEKKWENYRWDNSKYNNIHKRIKNKESLINVVTEIIEDKDLTNKDRKKLTKIIDLRTTNLIGEDSVNIKIGDKKLSSSVSNLLRDAIDMGRDVFIKPKEEQLKIFNKILKINKVKSIGALLLASGLGLINQYINRKITEKRTGTKGFVGDIDYQNKIAHKESTKDTSRQFLLEKLLASAGMVIMAIGVMRVKSPKDFLKKLEFTGPVNSGNVIKTVYASTLVGRFLASDNIDELRETVTRDYLGFLNWLVLGGFFAKGVANILDPKRENIFKGKTNGKGIKNWLNNLSLKSHNEIAVKGKDFAKKNMWKLNVAHISGLAYSTVALGILLPKLNIYVTKRKHKNEQHVN